MTNATLTRPIATTPPAVHASRLSFAGILRSEWIKALSLRSIRWSIGTSIVAGLAMSLAMSFALRALMKDPVKADRVVLDYRRAGLSEKHMAMLDFAVKLTLDPVTVAEEDIDELRAVGFSDEDVWDIVEVTAMFNFTNRLMSGVGAMPNPEYHGMAR